MINWLFGVAVGIVVLPLIMLVWAYALFLKDMIDEAREKRRMR